MRARIALSAVLSLAVIPSARSIASAARRHHSHHTRAAMHFPAGHRVVILFAYYTSTSAARTEAYRLEPRLAACVTAARVTHAPLLDEIASITARVHLQYNGRASHVEIFPTRLPASLSACLADPLLDWHQPGPARAHHPEIHLGLGLAP